VRLVVPAGESADTVAEAIGKTATWAEVAAEAGLGPEDVVPIDGEWAIANGASGLGFAEEAPPPAPAVEHVAPLGSLAALADLLDPPASVTTIRGLREHLTSVAESLRLMEGTPNA
jgi:hypothetical protein